MTTSANESSTSSSIPSSSPSMASTVSESQTSPVFDKTTDFQEDKKIPPNQRHLQKIPGDDQYEVGMYRKAEELYKAAADEEPAGDPIAQYKLGRMYFKGRQGVIQDDYKARKYLVKAANQGLAAAQKDLGDYYTKTSSFECAFIAYQEAAEQGYVAAEIGLGNCYAEGLGVKKDSKEALAHYKKASDQGEAEGQARYRMEENLEKAENYYLSLLTQQKDVAEASYYLAIINLKEGDYPYYRQKALEYITQTVERGNNKQIAAAIDLLEKHYHYGYYPPETEPTYDLAAKKDNPQALAAMARICLNKRDIKLAKSYCFRAANQGNQKAIDLLYSKGWVIDFIDAYHRDANPRILLHNPEEYFSWSKKLSFPHARFREGECYYTGYGTSQDYKSARGCFLKILASEYFKDKDCIERAHYYLGEMYLNGKGGEKNTEEAITHLKQAGEIEAAKALLQTIGSPKPADAKGNKHPPNSNSKTGFSFARAWENFNPFRESKQRGKASINSEKTEPKIAYSNRPVPSSEKRNETT